MRNWNRNPLSPPSHDPLMALPAGTRVEEVASGVRAAQDIPLQPASDEEVIAALGRAFALVCARSEDR